MLLYLGLTQKVGATSAHALDLYHRTIWHTPIQAVDIYGSIILCLTTNYAYLYSCKVSINNTATTKFLQKCLVFRVKIGLQSRVKLFRLLNRIPSSHFSQFVFWFVRQHLHLLRLDKWFFSLIFKVACISTYVLSSSRGFCSGLILIIWPFKLEWHITHLRVCRFLMLHFLHYTRDKIAEVYSLSIKIVSLNYNVWKRNNFFHNRQI